MFYMTYNKVYEISSKKDDPNVMSFEAMLNIDVSNEVENEENINIITGDEVEE